MAVEYHSITLHTEVKEYEHIYVHILMIMKLSPCMSCRIRGELQSLRAAVKRFEDGSETAALITAHEADQRRMPYLQEYNDKDYKG